MRDQTQQKDSPLLAGVEDRELREALLEALSRFGDHQMRVFLDLWQRKRQRFDLFSTFKAWQSSVARRRTQTFSDFVSYTMVLWSEDRSFPSDCMLAARPERQRLLLIIHGMRMTAEDLHDTYFAVSGTEAYDRFRRDVCRTCEVHACKHNPAVSHRGRRAIDVRLAMPARTDRGQPLAKPRSGTRDS